MSNLDQMTKAELLDYAREIGASPANNDMTKDEIRASIDQVEGQEAQAEPGQEPEVDPQVTTTMTKDYLGVPLVNAVPGTSQATDRLGRSVVAGNKDYLARNLVP